MVHGRYNVERGGRQKDQESGSREQGTPARIDASEKEGRVSLQGKKEIWKVYGERTWTSRMRSRAVKNWSKRKTAEGATRCRQVVVIFQGNAGEHQGVTAAPAARGGDKEKEA